ncbi:Bcl-2-related ovarian killer protein [Halotydeus destructor]|nr:Bcl-2-related ovarian killer protein [Halotydeus destructor]
MNVFEEDNNNDTYPEITFSLPIEDVPLSRVVPTIREPVQDLRFGDDHLQLVDDQDDSDDQPKSLQLLRVPSIRPRKFSLPILSFETEKFDAITLIGSGTRRLSQVGQAVSQHLSSIGWKSSQNCAEVSDQGKCLFAKFLRFRLKKLGFDNRQFHVQQLRNITVTRDHDTEVHVSRVFYVLKHLSFEMDKMSPKLYQSVTENIGNPKAIFTSQSAMTETHQLISEQIFKTGITWTKIASFYLSTAALIADCIRCRHNDYVLPLIDSLTDIVGQNLSAWIAQQGGW